MAQRLQAGDTVCYSAGSRQQGPDGYRVMKAAEQGSWLSLVERLPALQAVLGGPRPPLVINAYPATFSPFDFAVFTDTYLSHRTCSRALQLAAAEGHPAILLGQPLFVADALLAHLRVARVLPRPLVLVMGGYVLPLSLETMIAEACRELSVEPLFIHAYGVAEVGPACLVGLERNENGQVLYQPRSAQVKVEIGNDDEILLTLDGPGGVRRFKTGDRCAPCGDERYVVWNPPERANPAILGHLETWTAADWQRRTGYLRHGDPVRVQLRSWCSPARPGEIEHFEFSREFGGPWLEKPMWGRSR